MDEKKARGERQLGRFTGEAKAVRQAMALVRQNPTTSHPYYWAPFILVGDSDNSFLATFGTSR